MRVGAGGKLRGGRGTGVATFVCPLVGAYLGGWVGIWAARAGRKEGRGQPGNVREREGAGMSARGRRRG